jgi:nicotinamidase-related amidase
MKALVIVDMLDDFVHGALANSRAEAIIPPLQELLSHARQEGWVRVFANDAHEPGDPELTVWGQHAMAGTPGAEVIAELAPEPGPLELVVPKQAYGAFDGTALDEQLRALNVSEVVLAGQHTHICIRHTAYGALIRGYRITVPRDAVCAFEGVNEDEALEYLRIVYGAHPTTVSSLIEHRVPAAVDAATPLGAEYENGSVLEHEP